MDAEIAFLINEINKQKQHLVEQEDYDGAKVMKGITQQLKEFGTKIGALNAKKHQAAIDEDYDLAKKYKSEIGILR